jgi:hypothetical protein
LKIISSILWRKIKYEWLKAEDYLSAAALKDALDGKRKKN